MIQEKQCSKTQIPKEVTHLHNELQSSHWWGHNFQPQALAELSTLQKYCIQTSADQRNDSLAKSE